MHVTLRRLILGVVVVLAYVNFGAYPVQAEPVIAAYQKVYGMNFEVWLPQGFPSGWYATFDGYPVAQVASNHWVYGRLERGILVPTNIAVGSVVPMDLPYLARAAVSLERSGVIQTPPFQSIAMSGLDNMGVLDDPLAPVPVAWKTGSSELVVWLGDRWFRIVTSSGQRTFQALEMKHPFIVRRLQERNVVWTRTDTEALADIAREWGFVWHGKVPFVSFTVSVPADGSTKQLALGDFSGTSSQPGGGSSSGGGGNWDVGGGEESSSGGGGGWDTGGGGGSSGGGGGWDSGGGSGGNEDDNGGGWDK